MTTDWPRVGRYIRSRRKSLKLTQTDLQKDGGPSPALLRQIENGTYSAEMHALIQRSLEHNLQWRFGSIAAIHDGREPSPWEDEVDEAEVEKLLKSVVDADRQGMGSIYDVLARWVAAKDEKAKIEEEFGSEFEMTPEEAREALEDLAHVVEVRRSKFDQWLMKRGKRAELSVADESMNEAALETEPGLDESPGGSESNE